MNSSQFRKPVSTANEVANLALPFAHPLNAVICSAINLDNGTKSLSWEAMVRSLGSWSTSNDWNTYSTNTDSISLPVSPSVTLANCTRS